MGSAILISGVRLRTAEPVRQRQALIHLLPEDLTPLGRHGERTVMQITAEVAEGIADAPPVVGVQLLGGKSHPLILPRASLSAGTLRSSLLLMHATHP
mgnify:CR=1 FL=1